MNTPTLKNTVAALILLGGLNAAFAQGTAFTYQGRLNSGGAPVNGTYDLVFTIYDLPTGPGAFANQTNAAVAISNGLFTVTLDFVPGIFTGPERWVEIAVRTNGGGAYTNLSPRQKITATPYAITASNLSGTISAGQLNGTIPLGQLPAAVVTNNQSGVNFTGSFSGNGAGLSNVTTVTTNAWRLGGNSGTTAGTHFVGTTDNQPLELQVNSTRALRIEPRGGAAPSLVGGYFQNSASTHHGAVVAGGGTSGSPNYAQGNYAFVGAGHGGQAADYSAVVAGAYNVSPGLFSFIGSGHANTNLADYSVIAGGTNNFIATGAIRAFIGGGMLNSNLSESATIVGGALNVASGAGAFVGGGGNNAARNFNATVAGGANNRADENASIVSGGSENVANGDHSTISGGQANTASGPGATVGGGSHNTATGYGAALGGGDYNTVSGSEAVVGGGGENVASGPAAFVGAGGRNVASSRYATVAGGYGNTASGTGAFVGGGGFDGMEVFGNLASGVASTVGGGLGNSATDAYATAGGGYGNIDGGYAASTGGGFQNTASGAYATIPGGSSNIIAAGASASAIGGGTRNSVQASFSVVGGGQDNLADALSPTSVIGGGRNNQVHAGSTFLIFDFPGDACTVAGGANNLIDHAPLAASAGATISGGQGNVIQSGMNVTIAGGLGNQITSGSGGTIGGGSGNVIAGDYAVIPGGANNYAGNYSFAAGHRAKATHTGAFIWADSQDADFASTGANQFLIRAVGGVQLNTDTSVFFGNQTRQMLNLFSTQYGIGVQSAAAYFRTDQEFMWYRGGSHSDTFGDAGAGGTQLMRLGSSGSLIIAGTLVQGSDRHIKQDFAAVNAKEVLEKVAALPIQTWTYTNDASRRHLGPVAQDFHAAFGLNGPDDKHIATVDEGGVALAAIQGLNQKLEDKLHSKDAEIRELKRSVAELREMVQNMARQQTGGAQ